MRIDDDLTKRIVRSDRIVGNGGDLFKESEHGGDSFRVDAVLRLLQAEHTLGDGVNFDDRQGEKAERPI